MMRNKRLLLTFGALLSAAVLLFASIPPTTIFDLDGNSAVDHGLPDWDMLNGTGTGGSNPGGSPGGSQIRTFVPGPSSPRIFTTGGSKDPLDVTSWKWTTGSVPDKDLLTNGYAAAYNSGGELLLMFGADRYAQNGDSNIGTWFFQDDVGPIAGGTFSGTHKDHDILVVSAFTKGGGISTITVWEWDHTCTGPNFPKNPTAGQCADNNLRVLFNQAGVCGTADACADVNSTDIPVTWPYTPKSGTSGIVPAGGFYEGGINLTQLLEAQGVTQLPCFTNFLEETRSSQSPSATLKDFIAGSFPLCGIEVSKTCPTCNIVDSGQTFQYSVNGTVHNKGVGTLYNVVVTDDAGTPSNATDDLTFTCGTLNADQTKTWGPTGSDCVATNTFTSTTQNPATNQAHASATTAVSGGTTVSADSVQVTCASCTVSPAITPGKSCSTALQVENNLVAVRVDYSGSVQNTGNEALTNVTVSEDHNSDGTTDVPSLPLYKNGVACGSPCTLLPTETATFGISPNTLSYFPDVLNLITPGRATFSDTVKVTATGVLSGQSLGPVSKSASCLLCPLGACPTQ